ncbi:MAG TPA: helix-turn-helix transcriptional regulator [Brumimicrobium sp.]|nr:helix-turn-helix transcriptional regulator [Brumimicrobium sp.]
MNRLNEILKKQGRTQAFLSRELNKSANTVNNWCRNNTQFTLVEAKRIAEILNCKIEDLIDEDIKEEKK